MASWEALIASLFARIGGVFIFAGRTVVAMPRVAARARRLRELVFQVDALGVGALPIVEVTGVLTGLLIGLQTRDAIEQFGIASLYPQMVTLALVRELSPTFVALIAGTRAASGTASELATMQVTQQIDAMRALRRDPVQALAAPRVLASLLVFPMLGLVSVAAGLVGSMMVAVYSLKQTASYFFYAASTVLSATEILPNLVLKPALFGFLIGTLACSSGLAARGGTTAVGLATVRAVVQVTVAIIVADYFAGRFIRWAWPPPPF